MLALTTCFLLRYTVFHYELEQLFPPSAVLHPHENRSQLTLPYRCSVRPKLFHWNQLVPIDGGDLASCIAVSYFPKNENKILFLILLPLHIEHPSTCKILEALQTFIILHFIQSDKTCCVQQVDNNIWVAKTKIQEVK